MGLGVAGSLAAAASVASIASAGVGVAGSLSAKKGQSGAISTGQQQANAVLQPYVDTGENALTQYANITGVNGPDAATKATADFTASPGYQWQLGQGERAVDAGAAAKGMLRSGATMKGETDYAEGLAKQDFGSYVSRLNDLAGFGIKGAFGQAGTDTSAAGQQASIAGNETAGITNAIGGLAGNKDIQNTLAKYFSTPSSGSIYGTSGFQTGAGGSNSSGADTLQSLGLYNPLPTTPASGGY